MGNAKNNMQACSDPHHLFHKLAEHKETLLRQSTKLSKPRSLLTPPLVSIMSCFKNIVHGKKMRKDRKNAKLTNQWKKQKLCRKCVMLTFDHTITFAVPRATITNLLAHWLKSLCLVIYFLPCHQSRKLIYGLNSGIEGHVEIESE